MNQDERAVLQDRITSILGASPTYRTWKWVLLWIGGLALCAAFGALIVSSNLPSIMFGVLVGLVGIAAVVCLYAIIALASGRARLLSYQRRSLNTVPSIQGALALNKVAVKQVRASSVISIRPLEDESAGYIFDIGEGRLVFLMGDQYAPVRDSMPWPNTDFEIVRSLDGQVWIGVFCYGVTLHPSRVIEGWAYREDVLCVEHEEVVEASAGGLVESIMCPAERK